MTHLSAQRSARELALPPDGRWATIILGFAIGFSTMAQRTGLGVLYPAIVAESGWSVSEVTSAFSTAMLVYSPMVVVIGQLVDRLGVRTTMLAGVTVVVLGWLLTGFATELWQLYVGYGIALGFGGASVGFVPTMKALSMRSGRQLGLAIGLFNAGQGVGSLLAAPLLQVLIDLAGWRLASAALGGCMALLVVPLALAGAPSRHEGHTLKPTARGASLSGLWRQPAFWLMLLANASVGYLMLLPAHQVAHLTQVGFSPLVAATIGGLMGACIGLGALLGGWLTDRIGAGRIGPAAALALTVGILGLIGASPAILALAGLYALLGGTGRGMLGVNTAAFQTRVFAGPALGRISGFIDLGFGLGAFAGPYLTGLSYDHAQSYVPGLASAIVAATVGALTTLAARRITQASKPGRAPAGH